MKARRQLFSLERAAAKNDWGSVNRGNSNPLSSASVREAWSDREIGITEYLNPDRDLYAAEQHLLVSAKLRAVLEDCVADQAFFFPMRLQNDDASQELKGYSLLYVPAALSDCPQDDSIPWIAIQGAKVIVSQPVMERLEAANFQGVQLKPT